MLKVRLYRPFDGNLRGVAAASVKSIAVLDRTKEPGASASRFTRTCCRSTPSDRRGVATSMPRVMGGRYGLSSMEFTPAMVKGVFDELNKAEQKNHFTVGI